MNFFRNSVSSIAVSSALVVTSTAFAQTISSEQLYKLVRELAAQQLAMKAEMKDHDQLMENRLAMADAKAAIAEQALADLKSRVAMAAATPVAPMLALSGNISPVYAVDTPSTQAVSALNVRVELGGGKGQSTLGYASASVAVPLGDHYAFQADALGGINNSSGIAAAAGHIFTRNPTKGAVGVYASFTYATGATAGSTAETVQVGMQDARFC